MRRDHGGSSRAGTGSGLQSGASEHGKTLRAARKKLTRSLVAAAHRLLSFGPGFPSRVCVYGAPDYEENSLMAAVSLAESGSFDVTLLARRPERAQHYLALVNPHGAPVEVIRKHSLRGLVRASTAGVLLFTHGLYGAPGLTARKLVVNLWHGFGPKATGDSGAVVPIRYSVMTCDTPVWAAAAARAWGTPTARLVQAGNPRQVNLRNPPNPSALSRLGLTSGSYVIWMPTYRSTNGTSRPAWRDAPDLSTHKPDGETLDPVTSIAELARAIGIDVVVKPHPLDADRYEHSGLPVVRTDQIFDAGMTLYQFIGASAAMISDYSSVWVEYLDLDRPLLLYCPDIREYVRGRGLSRPYMTDLAGSLIVEHAEGVRPFLEAVEAGADWRPHARAEVRTALGLDSLDLHRASPASVVLAELEKGRPSPSRRP